MSEQPQPEHPTDTSTSDGEDQVVVIGPDGQPIGTIPASALPTMTQADGDGDGDGDGERHITELVEQPAERQRLAAAGRATAATWPDEDAVTADLLAAYAALRP